MLGQRTIERNQLLVKIAKSKLNRKRDDKSEKVTRPEELVRLYDLLLQVTTAHLFVFFFRATFLCQITEEISHVFLFLRMSLIFLISLALEETGNLKRSPLKKSVSAKAWPSVLKGLILPSRYCIFLKAVAIDLWASFTLSLDFSTFG